MVNVNVNLASVVFIVINVYPVIMDSPILVARNVNHATHPVIFVIKKRENVSALPIQLVPRVTIVLPVLGVSISWLDVLRVIATFKDR